jgi:hypothetical protein
MIVVLYPPAHRKIAEDIAHDLADAFFRHVEVTLIPASSCPAWPRDTSWDDLLILLYDHRLFPEGGLAFLTEYHRQRPDGLILPIVVRPPVSRPPGAAAGIKVLEYGTSAHGPNGRLANRVGGMLGLRVQGRDTRIFVSYRATDGAAITAPPQPSGASCNIPPTPYSCDLSGLVVSGTDPGCGVSCITGYTPSCTQGQCFVGERYSLSFCYCARSALNNHRLDLPPPVSEEMPSGKPFEPNLSMVLEFTLAPWQIRVRRSWGGFLNGIVAFGKPVFGRDFACLYDGARRSSPHL